MKDCSSFLLAKGMHLTENITLRYLSRYSVEITAVTSQFRSVNAEQGGLQRILRSRV